MPASSSSTSTRQLTLDCPLEREQERSRRRLGDAAIQLLDGVLDREGYEAARLRIQDDLEAVDQELARLQATRPRVELPPLDAVLREAGPWSLVLQAADIPDQREVLGALIERVVPVRVRWAVYRAETTWTPLGEALRQAADTVTQYSAK